MATATLPTATQSLTLGQIIRTSVVTKDALIAEVSVNKGARPITLKTATEPDSMFNKRDNPFWDKAKQEWKCLRIAVTNGMINFNYQNAVNRQRDRENLPTTFVAKARQWGVHIKGTPLVEHTNKEGEFKTYLEVKVEKTLSWKLIHKDTSNDFTAADLAIIHGFDKPFSPSRQGVQDEVILRDFDLDNIIGLTIDGKGFRFVF